MRREAGKGEAIGRKSRDREGCEDCRRAGNGRHRNTFSDGLARQLVARIRNQRRSRIRDQGNARTLTQIGENARPDALAIMIVIGGEFDPQVIGIEQTSRDPGILREDAIDTAQNVQRPQGDVAQIADWR